MCAKVVAKVAQLSEFDDGPDQSVPPPDADFLQETSSGLEATDVRGDLGYQLGDSRPPRHVRHHRNLGMKPERAFRRQRLGPKGIQCGV